MLEMTVRVFHNELFNMSIERKKIVELARGWIGTPYHHQASLKGVGTDCLGLVHGVFREIYGHKAETPPDYSPDWAEATGFEAMLKAAGRHLDKQSLERMMPGDVIVFRLRSGMVAKHAAIVSAPQKMIHAMEGVPVSEVSLSSWWWRHIAGVYSFPGVV
jgi:NlpC/P60 family putative phage cell wall peptidase